MKSNKIKIVFFVMIFFTIICMTNKVNATNISISPSSPKVGDTVTITVTVPNVNTADVTANVSGAVTGTIKVVGGNVSDEASTYKKSATFTCDKEGKIEVSITEDSSAVLNGEYVNVGASTSVNVENVSNIEQNTETSTNTNVENTQQQSNEQEQGQSQETPVPQEEPQTPAETKKSSNANLSNLGIRPNDFKGFKPGTLDYSVNVPNNVEKINVYATVQDKNAKIVSGTGSQNLNVGNNAIKVVVRAEDGTEKTYTINVTREEKKEEENKPENEVAEETAQENAEENQVKSDLVKLEIEGQKLTPSFSADIYEYKIDVSKDIESLNVITEGANENINIEVAGNKEIKEGENLITILVYNNETKQNSTYQIIVNKESAEATGTENVNSILNSTIKKAKRNRYIVIGIGAFILVCIIVFIIAKNRNQDEDDDEYDEDEDNNEINHDERINLSEEEGLFRRVNREDFKLEEKTKPNNINGEKQEKVTFKPNFEKNQNALEDRRKGKHF